MTYRIMGETDIPSVIPLYIEYYNDHEGDNWTEETTRKRIHQVITREDAYCLLMEDGNLPVGFIMGYFEQYDDCVAYDLVEIVIASAYQHKGYGTRFLAELESRVKEMGAALIQLTSVNDEAHNRFYEGLQFKPVANLVLKTKWL